MSIYYTLCMIYANILNAVSNIEQVLEAAPLNAVVVRPLTTHPLKTIQVRRTRHAGYCWRSRNELIIDILLWTPSHWRAKARGPARIYVHQLCADTGWSLEDLLEEMNDREGWQYHINSLLLAGPPSIHAR